MKGTNKALIYSGSQYDKNGNLVNWWNENSQEGFSSRKECVIQQYSSFVVPDTNVTVRVCGISYYIMKKTGQPFVFEIKFKAFVDIWNEVHIIE